MKKWEGVRILHDVCEYQGTHGLDETQQNADPEQDRHASGQCRGHQIERVEMLNLASQPDDSQKSREAKGAERCQGHKVRDYWAGEKGYSKRVL